MINDVSEIFSQWGSQLRSERVAKGLLAKDVAHLAGVDAATVSRVEAGTAGFFGYAQVAAALGLTFALEEARAA